MKTSILKITFLIPLLCFGSHLFSQKNTIRVQQYKLKDIGILIFNAKIDSQGISTNEISGRIDFDNLKFFSKSLTDSIPKDYFRIGFNETKEAKIIDFYEGGNIRYRLLRLHTPKNITAFEMHVKGFSWPFEKEKNFFEKVGTLVYLDSMCFITNITTSKISSDPLGRLTRLMYIDKDLHVISYCIFEDRRLTHVAQVQREYGSIKSILIFNPFKCDYLTDDSCVSEFAQYNVRLKKLDQTSAFIANVELKKNKEFLKYPLWYWGGNFTYK